MMMQDLFDIQLTEGALAVFARVVVIVIAAFAAAKILRRVIDGMAKRTVDALETRNQKESKERVQRVTTLSGIGGKSVTIAIWATAIIMVLREAGFDVIPLLAGAGVVGLAIGLGAQNLIRDVISGAFLVVDNQMGVGDVVSINGTGGAVMEINLRTTVLRDFEGVVHVFPNGTISTLSNRTRTFSHYVFDVGVAYKEDPDRVMHVLRDLGANLVEDPDWKDQILEPVEVLGLDRFEDSAIVIKMRVKTNVGKQWAVGREMNRRIKKRFDEEGIEIPFPHRTVFLADSSRTPPLLLDDSARAEIRQIIREEIANAVTR